MIIYTDAPKVYDWGYTTELDPKAAINRRGDYVRKVEIDETLANPEGQRMRYWSGMHLAFTEEEFAVELEYAETSKHALVNLWRKN